MQSVLDDQLVSANSIRTITLTTEEQRELTKLTSSISGDPYSDFESFYQNILKLQAKIPQRIRREIEHIKNLKRGGAVIIKRLPLGNDLPPTPDQPFAKITLHDLRSEIYLVLLATLIAEPFSFREWDAGHLVHNKYPIKSHREVQFGSNAVEFLVHTETPFREFSPDYIALLCLRGDPTGRANTKVCDIEKIISELSDDEREILKKPYFAFETDNPAVQINGKSYTLPMPIITSRNGEDVFEYVHDLVAISEESQEVLDKLKGKVASSITSVFLEGGDLIIIDNSHMVHGRSAYEPNYDGTDRWLQRLLLTSRLYRNKTNENRLISDKRLENYTTAYQNVLQGLS
ncbi:MAG: TauD/TfdA family dioxygenase [Pyrinomonadaceae bacterium]|nr:TauD/TfdA family dioxygenase [Pyrinomonadaceae bacterium]